MHDTDRLLELDRHMLHPLHSRAEHDPPVALVRGRGSTVWDSDGREYLDAFAGPWDVPVGHGRKEPAEAAAAQMECLAYCSSYAGLTNEPAVRLGARKSEKCNIPWARNTVAPEGEGEGEGVLLSH
jgi:adenosylmethionine-8-amino-7-oxononanoate aminotransferase